MIRFFENFNFLIAENQQEIVTALFTEKTTPVYLAKRKARSIDFYLVTGDKRKVATLNVHGVLCACYKQENGKYWYNFACPDAFPREIYDSPKRLKNEIAQAVSIGRDSIGYIYK